MTRLLALATAAIAATCLAAPAEASGLPPLGLTRGQGSVGLGFVQAVGDVAVADGLTVGLGGYFIWPWAAANARLGWTAWQGTGGAVGLLAGAGVGAGYSGGTLPFVQLAPMYESPPWVVRVRGSLGLGVYGNPTRWYADGSSASALGGSLFRASPLVAAGTSWDLALQPTIELVVPIDAHWELTLLGNQLAGVYGRW